MAGISDFTASLGAKGRQLVLEHLGRDPHPTGAGQAVLHIRSGDPARRFEWHPKKRIVYMIRASAPNVGEAVALDIETHGDAINAVNIWQRGFNEGAAPELAKPHLQV